MATKSVQRRVELEKPLGGLGAGGVGSELRWAGEAALGVVGQRVAGLEQAELDGVAEDADDEDVGDAEVVTGDPGTGEGGADRLADRREFLRRLGLVLVAAARPVPWERHLLQLGDREDRPLVDAAALRRAERREQLGLRV